MTELIALPVIVAFSFTVYFAAKWVGEKTIEGAKKISTPSTDMLLRVLLVIAIVWLTLHTVSFYRYDF